MREIISRQSTRAGNWIYVCARIAAAAIVVLIGFAGTSFAQKKTPPPTPVDLNLANAKELEQIPGIGPVTAKSIIDFRQKSGSFKRVEDLLVIRGISERKLKADSPLRHHRGATREIAGENFAACKNGTAGKIRTAEIANARAAAVNGLSGAYRSC